MKRSTICLTLAFVITVLISGCGSSSSSQPVSTESIQSSIQKELNDNPKIKDKGFTVKVTQFNNGFLTLNVTGASSVVASKINGGTELSTIYMGSSMSVGPLMEAEETLKKRPEVKGIKWTAN